MDLFGFQRPTLTDNVRRYFSGVAAPAIWMGYEDAGVPMCLVVAKLPAQGTARAKTFVAKGGTLLLDSGAFLSRAKPAELDWPAILSTYQDIADAGPVTLVLPDVVGDQQATLELLAQHRSVLQTLFDHPNVTALLPLQGGAMPLDTFHAEALSKLGFMPDGVALPSHAAALPPSSLKDLVRIEHQPRRVHLLGVSRNAAKLGDRLLRILEVWPDADISADACEHRAQVGQNKPITVRREAALNALLDDAKASHDDTEDDEASDAALETMSKLFPDLDEEELSDLMCSGWGAQACTEQRAAMNEKAFGPTATRTSIREFAIRETSQRPARPTNRSSSSQNSDPPHDSSTQVITTNPRKRHDPEYPDHAGNQAHNRSGYRLARTCFEPAL